ncbi:MAG: hypothetical protein J2P50_16875 [Hyphomicrobiaceae bacterium]|nr:hypothetical protein [Hyphomicrobiaceae bacterium]
MVSASVHPAKRILHRGVAASWRDFPVARDRHHERLINILIIRQVAGAIIKNNYVVVQQLGCCIWETLGIAAASSTVLLDFSWQSHEALVDSNHDAASRAPESRLIPAGGNR